MRAAKHCAEHEGSQKHREALEHMKSSTVEDTENIDESSGTRSSSDIPDDLYNDGDDLLFIPPSSPLLQNNESRNSIGSLAERLSYNIDPTFEESIILKMSSTLRSYYIQGPELDSSVYSGSDSGDERSDTTLGMSV